MTYLLPIFKAVNLIFSLAAVATGLQALLDPIGFSKSFGLPIQANKSNSVPPVPKENATTGAASEIYFANSYVTLMGVRQLGTGILLLVFNYQGKHVEAATVLAIIGVVVAGTDGLVLARRGDKKAGIFHAVPGALIAALAGAVLYYEA